MRGKKAKRLRNIAEYLSVGLPECRYTEYEQQRSNPNLPRAYGIKLDECTRKVYQSLK